MRTVDVHPPLARTLRPVPALVLMARPSQVALVVLVALAGALLGAWRGSAAAPDTPAMAALLGLALLLPATIATHWANEAADAETDARSQRTAFSGGSGALARSGLAASVPLRLAVAVAAGTALVAAAIVAAGALAPLAGTLLLLGLAGGLAYSLPPVAAMRRGWGEPLNALLGGLLLPLYGVAVMQGTVGPLDAVAFLPFTVTVFCSVMATAWPDRAADAATGKHTLQVRWPVPRLRALHLAATVAWVGGSFAVIALDALPMAGAGLLIAPLLLLGHVRYTRGGSPWPSVAAMVLHVAITAITVALALAGWRP